MDNKTKQQMMRTASIRLAAALLILSAGLFPKFVKGQFKPDDRALYDTIVHMDSVFFGAYNTCTVHLQEYSDIYADSLEFYHDKGGLSTSKQDVVAATKRNICGKVTRELVAGSLEIYPIAGFGAIEIGFHRFHNSEEPNAKGRDGRFVIVWHRTEKGWKVTRVISLH